MGILSGPGHLYRLFRTIATLARSGALEQVMDIAVVRRGTRRVMRVLLAPVKPLGERTDPAIPPLPAALIALGPAYVKFGQALSTRPDVVGTLLAGELSRLQDTVPPFPEDEARAVVEAELGKPVEALFDRFEPAIAAASIAQVHPATTREGRRVAVKILRPGVERRFRRDIDAFLFASRWVERLVPMTRRLRPVAVTENFLETTEIELDLRLEAAAASEFAENIANDQGFRIPGVDWQRSARRILTTDWIEGTPVARIEEVIARGHDPKHLSEITIQSFLRHALRDGFFHADMHQGNLRVDAEGNMVAIDFGIMGRLDPVTRHHYAQILLAFLERDYSRAAHVHREAGYLPADQPVDAFAQALRSVGEPIFGLGAANISMGRLLAQLFAVTEQFGMQTQTQLILLQKTMIMVEGVARGLDPDVNMWSSAKPVITEWMRGNLGPARLLKDTRETAMILARLGPRLPELAEQLLLMIDRPPPPPGQPWWPAALAGAAAGAFLTLLVALALA